MNAVIKLITESDETPEFSDFYAEPETWLEQLLNLLFSRGFRLYYRDKLLDSKHGKCVYEIYKLKNDNVQWYGVNAAETYEFILQYPEKTELPVSFVFSMQIESFENPATVVIYYSTRISRKKLLAKEVEFMKLLVEKTIALANKIRPHGDACELRGAIIGAIIAKMPQQAARL